MKILFPTDLSEESFDMIHKLLPKIIDKEIQTEIILFHVVNNTQYGATTISNITKIMHDDASDKLFAQKKIMNKEFGVEVIPRVRDGYYERELKWTVERTNPDLVVLISKAKHGVLKYINGQKSLKFIGELSAPLLVIPENFEFQKISKMGLAIDKEESPTIETLWKIKKLANYFKSEVKMFHVSTEQESESNFYQQVSETMGFGEIEMVEENNVLDGIKTWCQHNTVDVLISMTHPKGFFRRIRTGSVTRNLVKDNLTALLILTQ